MHYEYKYPFCAVRPQALILCKFRFVSQHHATHKPTFNMFGSLLFFVLLLFGHKYRFVVQIIHVECKVYLPYDVDMKIMFGLNFDFICSTIGVPRNNGLIH